jgi:cytochrome c biogenesis protein CcmG, thiol:disulfide interchange protein DsbE
MDLRRLLFLLPVLIFIGVGIGLAVGLTRDPSTLPSALIDQPVPSFELPPIAGREGPGFGSADLVGGVSLVNVFASWCVPCRVEHPLMMALADDGVAIYGIDYKDPAEQAAAWLAELGDPYRAIGADRDGRVAIDWGVYGVPETFVIDRAGRIRYRFVGPLQRRDIEETLRPLLEQLEREKPRDPLMRVGNPEPGAPER